MNEPTILILDDDAVVLDSLRAILTAQGFLTQCYSTAEELLHTADLDSPGCVVTDLRMPGTDGVQLQEELLAAGSSLAVVVVTGHADIPVTVQLMQRGAVDVLEKPYHPQALVGAVRQALDRSEIQYQTAQQVHEVERRLAQLTENEKRVMRGMIAGQPIKSLARECGSSMRTIDRRRRTVLHKMRVKSIGELGAMLGQRKLSNESTNGSPNSLSSESRVMSWAERAISAKTSTVDGVNTFSLLFFLESFDLSITMSV